MMEWDLDFISQKDFDAHIEETISKYGEALLPYSLKRLNSNLIDPVKLIFDKSVYGSSWEETIKSEVFRQRDKPGNNSIGYFHQRMFNYIKGCVVPKEGWDVIFKTAKGFTTPDGNLVHTIYVEMKNKHNTMNSASSQRTYIKMQNQILQDDDCACYLVEAIAKQSQDIQWRTSVDGSQVHHRLIRRCSIDQFYQIATGDPLAFYKICKQLPASIERVLSSSKATVSTPNDTVFAELRKLAGLFGGEDDLAISMAVYLLGFNTYEGFRSQLPDGVRDLDNPLVGLYKYAQR